MILRKRLVVQACLLLHVAVWTVAVRRSSSSPTDIATRVGQALLGNEMVFVNWEGGFQYGPAIVVDGLYEALGILNDETIKSQWEKQLSETILQRYKVDPRTDPVHHANCSHHFPYGEAAAFRSCAFAILSTDMPFSDYQFGNVGDQMNLFPINYLRRYDVRGETEDYDIAKVTVDKYLLPFPLRLEVDNTFSRGGGCCVNATSGDTSYVWADDQYMGMALMARLSRTNALSLQEKRKLVDYISTMQLQFRRHIYDLGGDGLIYHGAYVNKTAKLHSCCKWGRANGWGAMSHLEVLESMEQFPDHPNRIPVLSSFVHFIDSMMKFQDASTGRWHQVVNETSTYLETSVTAMMVTAMATGVERGWLPSSLDGVSAYEDAALKAWEGLASQVTANGTVLNICMGTGIMPTKEGYNGRGRDYWQSSPGGVGTVLRAAVAIDKFLKR